MRGRAAALREPGVVAAGAIGSALVHGAILALALVAVPSRTPGPPVYAVNLVAAPAPTTQQRLATEAVARPAPPTPAPPTPARKTAQVEAKPAPKAKASPAPSEAKPRPADPKVEKAPPTRSEVAPLPGETPSTGSDVATIQTPGLQFPFPEYLRNLMNQVLRRWNGSRTAYRAEIAFLILKDGSVRDIRFLKRSGNFAFDLDAQGAIEAAGNAGAFGPLPDGWDANVLPITFVFEPRGR